MILHLDIYWKPDHAHQSALVTHKSSNNGGIYRLLPDNAMVSQSVWQCFRVSQRAAKNDALRWVGVLQVLKIFRSKIIKSEAEKYSFASAVDFLAG